jgi:hypothetical protein
VALNCFMPLTGTEAVVGEMDVDTGFSVIAAEADLVLSADDVALTVEVEVLVKVAGAL